MGHPPSRRCGTGWHGFPSLQVIIGHRGETLPFMLARIDKMFSKDASAIDEPVSQILQQLLWVTTSGTVTKGPLDLLHQVFGTERTMFSIDYPFESLDEGRAFLDSLDLDPDLLERFAHGNADTLLHLTQP